MSEVVRVTFSDDVWELVKKFPGKTKAEKVRNAVLCSLSSKMKESE